MLRPDLRLDGWCWSPERPQERLLVDLLVDDHPAVSVVAAMFRPDLLARGCGDGRHGFAVHLPANLPQLQRECLVTARERQSGRIFGRLLRPGATGPSPRERAAAAAIAELSDDLARLHAGQPAGRMRAAFGRLAATLAPRPSGLPYDADLLVPAGLRLARVERPAISLVLPDGSAAAAAGRIAALAPALAAARAELLLVDRGADPRLALLPAALPGLGLLAVRGAEGLAGTLALAAAVARGRWLVLLGAATLCPSAAALLALARMIGDGDGVLLAAAAAGGLADGMSGTLALPAPLGVLFGGPTELCRRLGAAAADDAGPAGLALRARLLGQPWRCVTEPRGA